MAGLNTEIEVLKKEMERSKQDLNLMYLELGEVAAKWHQAINYEPSQKAFEELIGVVKEKEDIDSKISAIKTAVSDMSEGDVAIERTKTTMKSLDEQYNMLISSLGAVAVEIYSAGRLPQRLERCLSPMKDYESKLESLNAKLSKYNSDGPRFMSSIYEKKVEKMKANLDDVFVEVGKRIYKSGDFREVPGQRAKAILDEMEDIRLAKDNYKNAILDQKSAMNQAQGSLQSMGAYGEESKALREYKATERQIMARLEEKYTQYGSILASGMEYWMDDQAPEDLMRCCSQIVKQNRKMSQQSFNFDHMRMSKDIEIHNLQMVKLSEQMNHLNSQIQAIENQKSELQQKIDLELKAISELKMKQNEISRQAAEL